MSTTAKEILFQMWSAQCHSAKLPTMSEKRCTESWSRRERPRSAVTAFPEIKINQNVKPNIVTIANDNRPYAEIEVKNHKVIGLLDSGPKQQLWAVHTFLY